MSTQPVRARISFLPTVQHAPLCTAVTYLLLHSLPGRLEVFENLNRVQHPLAMLGEVVNQRHSVLVVLRLPRLHDIWCVKRTALRRRLGAAIDQFSNAAWSRFIGATLRRVHRQRAIDTYTPAVDAVPPPLLWKIKAKEPERMSGVHEELPLLQRARGAS
mmetsp:Transcript_35057/g.74824  ORF Transcript_35057/g.74824 Transcript_35057/m.74824 type:complete len:160 (+) Transcript_35057:236-715(+)